MSKLLRFLIMLLICFGLIPIHETYANTINPIITVTDEGNQILIKVNGSLVNFLDQGPCISGERTLVPVRFISESLGAEVTWNDPEIRISANNKNLVLAINSKNANLNGNTIIMEVAPLMIGDRAMVPLRFIADVFGAEVHYQQNNTESTPDLNEQKKWGIAISALIKEVNGIDPYKIGGRDPTPDLVKSLKGELKFYYKIYDRTSALEEINWLKTKGHSSLCNELVKEIKKNSSDENQRSYKDKYPAKFELVKSNYNTLEIKSLKAWDYCRLVSVAEWCYILGYITEDEMWTEIFSAARILQATYSSWEDLGNNYLLGREFWSGNRDKNFEKAKNTLLSRSDSPWVLYKWNLPLNNSFGEEIINH